MQAKQHHSRRRRRAKRCPHLLPPAVVAAAVGVCFSASLLGVNAFVHHLGISSYGRPQVPRHGSVRAAVPPIACSAVEEGRPRSPEMVVVESPPATCRRAALQRAWRASSTESIAHEQVRLAAFPLQLAPTRVLILRAQDTLLPPSLFLEWNCFAPSLYLHEKQLLNLPPIRGTYVSPVVPCDTCGGNLAGWEQRADGHGVGPPPG